MEKTIIPNPHPTAAEVPEPHPRHRNGEGITSAAAGAGKPLVIALVTLVSVLAIAAVATFLPPPLSSGESPNPSAPPAVSPDEARVAASHKFLDNWVDADGRVVRRDQGNDTVSEGQAYGLLIAVSIGDADRFDRIWTWTRQHLQRPDGLLAWRWADGAVTDDAPAADADLDAARALVRAGLMFNRSDLTEEGNKLAAVVVKRLTAVTPLGRVLLPGPWAVPQPDLPYNPSYASPAAFEVLRDSTRDPRWSELMLGARATTSRLTQEGQLPPDWAAVSNDGGIHPQPGSAGQGPPVQYGYDAARLPVRFAESCSPEDVVLAGSVAPALERADPLLAVLNLDGTAKGGEQNAVSYVARAAARAAAENYSEARNDLQLAEDLNSLYPTYYGTAWLALGRSLLDSAVLGGCPPLASH
jgi:endo-1,4-beta-D-glucanase Y